MHGLLTFFAIHGSLMIGIIISGMMGLIAGNYATSPIYRLPRNKPIFAEDPYCGDCDHKLYPMDLFPVLSWLSTRGKCRYCGAPVPGVYTAVEAFVCVLFVVFYIQHGLTEPFLLLSFGTASLVMIAAMLSIDNFFSDRTFAVSLALAVVTRTLAEATVYGFAGGAFAGLMLGATVWKLSGKQMTRDSLAFPPYLKLLILAGAWLPFPAFIAILPLCGFAALVRDSKKWLPDYAIIGATIAALIIHM